MIPVVILLYIGAPSLYVLYSMDYDFLLEQNETRYFVKVIGHQWYWSYSSPLLNLENRAVPVFDRYIIGSNHTHFNHRLLDTDTRLIVPCQVIIKFFISSIDVLHSWALPSAGVKIDACPGRLNQIAVYFSRPGILYGQCSEICGANHRFIPIVLEVRRVAAHLMISHILLHTY